MKHQILIDSRRHRKRKVEYATTLENQKAELLVQDAEAKSEAQNLAAENAALRSILQSHGVDVDGNIIGCAPMSDNEDDTNTESAIEGSTPPGFARDTQENKLRHWLETESEFDDSVRSTIENCRKLLLESTEGAE